MINKIYKIGLKLFPICRSITGNGVRNTLKIIKKNLPKLKIYEVKSGTKVFDWKIPPEWNIKDAFVLDKKGKKIIDFKKNNLHLVGYSIPIEKKISKEKLFSHIHSLPKQPNAIPYITSYYKRYWGFCITENYKKKINKNYKKNDFFSVKINSSLDKKGSLTYGELILPGESKKEIFISTYVCHPSMANNELSGPLVSIALAKYFMSCNFLKNTLRFVFIPETIGSITYLSRNLPRLKKNVIAGYNLSCIGDERQYSFLPTKYGNTVSDKAALKAFNDLRIKPVRYSFLQRGSDERQYNSPGIDLPIASLSRTKYGEYPEYHTSLDNFNVVTKKGLQGGINVVKKAINIIMKNCTPKYQVLAEPQMGRRGLYPTLSVKKKDKVSRNFMNFLQFADGTNDLIDISNYIKLSFDETFEIFEVLKNKKLIKKQS